MTITGAQVKAARRLLGWSQGTLAGEIGVSATTVLKFEKGKRQFSVLEISAMRRALEWAGIEFVEGEPGAKLRKQ